MEGTVERGEPKRRLWKRRLATLKLNLVLLLILLWMRWCSLREARPAGLRTPPANAGPGS